MLVYSIDGTSFSFYHQNNIFGIRRYCTYCVKNLEPHTWSNGRQAGSLAVTLAGWQAGKIQVDSKNFAVYRNIQFSDQGKVLFQQIS